MKLIFSIKRLLITYTMEQQKLWTVVTWHSFELLGHCHEKQPCSRIRTYGIFPNHTAVLKKLSLLMRFLESLEWYVALLAKHCGTTAYLLQRTKPVKHPESGECHWISSIGIDLWTIINASLLEFLLIKSRFSSPQPGIWRWWERDRKTTQDGWVWRERVPSRDTCIKMGQIILFC